MRLLLPALLLCCGQTEDPILRVLLYLARHQAADGSWGERPAHCACPVMPEFGVRVDIEADDDSRRRFRECRELMQSERAAERERGQKLLYSIGMTVIPLLQEGLSDPDPELRGRCRETLIDLWTRESSVKELFRRAAAPETADLEIRATGLALLCFAGAGYSYLSRDQNVEPVAPYRPYVFGAVVKQGFRRLLERQLESGSFGAREPKSDAIAALALIEQFGMTASEVLREPAQRASKYILSLEATDASFAIWQEFVYQSTHRSDLLGGPRDPEKLLKQVDRSLSGALLAASFLKRPCEAERERFQWKDYGTPSPEEFFLSTMAVCRTWKPGTDQRRAWDESLSPGWIRRQIQEKRCDRGAWPDAPVLFEKRLLATAYAGLTVEQTLRYANALFPASR